MSETSSPFPFVVVGGARSGTTLLKNLLRSHPNLLSFSELFCPGRIYWDYPDMEHMETQETVTWRDAHPVEFMKAVYESEHEARFKGVGFKLLYNQLFSPELKPLSRYLFGLDGLRVVHIRRENLFKAYVSHRIGALRKARGMTLNAGSAEEVEVDTNISVEIYECESFFKSTHDSETKTRAFFANKPTMEVTYEGITKNMDQEMGTVLDFLDVPPAQLTTTSHKVRRQPVAEVVENYEELREHFSGGPYARFFTDDS